MVDRNKHKLSSASLRANRAVQRELLLSVQPRGPRDNLSCAETAPEQAKGKWGTRARSKAKSRATDTRLCDSGVVTFLSGS